MSRLAAILALIVVATIATASHHGPPTVPTSVPVPVPEPVPAPVSPCASGCDAAPPPDAPLHDADLRALLERFRHEPMSASSHALETLLFHHTRVRSFLDEAPDAAATLDAERRAFLDRALRITHAWVEIRVVNAAGIVRSTTGAARVPLGEKQHLAVHDGSSLRPHEFNGTVKRVGLYHLWTRW